MDFPKMISFTVTNACNLRCKMCGQWSEKGYMHGFHSKSEKLMKLQDWKKLVDEIADHGIQSLLIRGGEPFLYPSIIELLQYTIGKGIFVSIDTNGTFIDIYAEQIVSLKKIHLTFSIDGPKKVHDSVRAVSGTFDRVREGLRLLGEWETRMKTEISKGMTFTINWMNYRYLGEIPEVARQLGLKTIVIVPYFYITEEYGKQYESVLKEQLGCKAFTWEGFNHEISGIDFSEFLIQYRKYQANLKELYVYPYMTLKEEDYKTWFEDCTTPVDTHTCSNIHHLIDIQPSGEANFCVDLPDYSIGNAKTATIADLWKSERANAFRKYRQKMLLPVCYRCVAKHMSEH
jgi:MoaA/NifB/PqqE/SkfB family radical SAM enzyme